MSFFLEPSEGQTNKIDGYKHPYFFLNPGRREGRRIYAGVSRLLRTKPNL